jgi:hypothetical protein
MNETSVVTQDTGNNQYVMLVNGVAIQFSKVADYSHGGFNPHYHYSIRVANDFNQSGSFDVQARSINVLVRKLQNHPHKLVKPAV